MEVNKYCILYIAALVAASVTAMLIYVAENLHICSLLICHSMLHPPLLQILSVPCAACVLFCIYCKSFVFIYCTVLSALCWFWRNVVLFHCVFV